MLISLPGCHGSVRRANKLDERTVSQSNGNSLGNILDHHRDQINAKPSTWVQMTTCRRTEGDGIRQSIWKTVMWCSKWQPEGVRWLPRKWNWRIWRQRGNSSVLSGCHQGIVLSFPHHTTGMVLRRQVRMVGLRSGLEMSYETQQRSLDTWGSCELSQVETYSFTI